MLKELPKENSDDDSVRRWFSDENVDLALWYDSNRQIIGFQLSYLTKRIEKALTWTEEFGYAHYIVDDGDKRIGFYKETPILIPDESFSAQDVATQLLSVSVELDDNIVNFVMSSLFLYALELSPNPV